MAKKRLELPLNKNESMRSFLSGFDGIVKIVRKETLLYCRKSDVTPTLSGLSNLSYLLKRRDAAKIPRPCGVKVGRDGAAGSRFLR